MTLNMKALLKAAYELGRDRILYDPTNFDVLTATSEVADVDWIKVDDLDNEAKAEIIDAYERGEAASPLQGESLRRWRNAIGITSSLPDTPSHAPIIVEPPPHDERPPLELDRWDPDWIKRGAWDIPAHSVAELRAFLRGIGLSVEKFKRLVVYRSNVERLDWLRDL